MKRLFFSLILAFMFVFAITVPMRIKPLQISGAWIEIHVYDKITLVGIELVYIKLQHTQAPLEYSVITNKYGIASLFAPIGSYVFTLSHPSYEVETKILEVVSTTSVNTFSFYLTKRSQPLEGNMLTFYFRDQTNHPPTSCYVIYDSVKHPGDWTYGIAIVNNVPDGIHSFTFYGHIVHSIGDWDTYEFTIELSITKSATFTVLIAQGIVQEGIPPPPPSDWDILGWLMTNWWFILATFIFFYIFPYIFPHFMDLIKSILQRRRD